MTVICKRQLHDTGQETGWRGDPCYGIFIENMLEAAGERI